MNVEIDQSGRIEETNRDTVLAYSNGKSISVRIKARTKRRLLECFRMAGQPKLFTLRTFATAIFLLIKADIKKKDEVIIDVEYIGNDALILNMLEEMFETGGRKLNIPRISFKQIGKKCPAHLLAISVYRKEKLADRIIEFDELEEFAIKKPR